MDLGKYEIIDELGRGGFGSVYKARDKLLNRIVAVKVLHPNLVNDPTFLKRFRQEAQIAAQLDNPNLVPVYDFGESEGHYFIVMAYMPGGSLKDKLQENGAFSKEKTLQVFQQIASGLAYAHKRGVIHRDLKPGNILFDEEGKARVSDMGFAKLMHSDSSLSLTASGGIIGTPSYMATEIWRGKPATNATDIYSLACILVEMRTGEVLFSGESTPEIMLKHFDILHLPEDLPEEWKPVLEAALDKLQEERIQTVQEFLNQIKVFEKSLEESGNSEGNKQSTYTAKGVRSGTTERHSGLRKYPVKSTGEERYKKSALFYMIILFLAIIIGMVIFQAGKSFGKPAYIAPPDIAISGTTITPTNTTVPSKTNMPTLSTGASQNSLTDYIVQADDYTCVDIADKFNVDIEVFLYVNGMTWGDNCTLYEGKLLKIPAPEQQMPAEVGMAIAEPPLGIGSTQIRETDGMEQVYVPAGEFIMGSVDSDADGDEKPVRTVYLDAYWIDKYEVTREQYKKCVNDGFCDLPGANFSTYDNYPVTNINWDSARLYCEWAGGRLPTEAEWEKAARGENGRKYPWGNDVVNSSYANYNKTKGYTVAVGSYEKGKSPYGAMDMAGNVWEWVNDWYGSYNANETKNPLGSIGNSTKVIRGGSFDSSQRVIQSSFRDYLKPEIRSYYGGFRCLSSPLPVE